MSVWRVACRLTLLVALSGCSAKYQVTSLSPVDRPAERIDGVLVAEPMDGSFQGKPYAGSGHFVAHRAAVELQSCAAKVDAASSELQDRPGLIAAAQRANDTYLLIPAIEHWEQRAKGVPSRVALTMLLVKASSGENIGSTRLEGETVPAVLKEVGPNALAIHLIHDYVQQLCR